MDYVKDVRLELITRSAAVNCTVYYYRYITNTVYCEHKILLVNVCFCLVSASCQ